MYIAVSDLNIPEEVLVRLTDDEGAGSVNEDRAASAISAAQAVVDCALSRQYAVPLAGPPEIVRKLTHDIAVYNLYLRVGSMPEWVKEGYDSSTGILERLSKNELSMGLEPPYPSPGLTCQGREFSRELMEGF